MSEKFQRLRQVAKHLNVGISTITDFLNGKGYNIDNNPNSKIDDEQYALLCKEYADSMSDKKESSKLTIGVNKFESVTIKDTSEKKKEEEESFLITNNAAKNTPEEDSNVSKVKLQGIKLIGKIDLDADKKKKPQVPVSTPQEEAPVAQDTPVVEEPVVEKQEDSKLAPEIVHEENLPAQEEAAPVQEVSEKPEIEVSEPVQEDAKTEQPQVPETPKVDAVQAPQLVEARADSLKGLTVLGKIQLPVDREKAAKESHKDKKKRKRIKITKPSDDKGPSTAPSITLAGDRKKKDAAGAAAGTPGKKMPIKKAKDKEELSEKEIQDKIRQTLTKLGGNTGNKINRAKYRKEKRNAVAEANAERLQNEQDDAAILKVTEFISANDLASLMDVSVNEVIKVCMSMGMFVSINQRLDAEAITIISDEFGFKVEFISTEEESLEEEDDADDSDLLAERAPIVTIMGHVDHGKTSLLDYIRNTQVTAGEAGGITQHIGAYDVVTPNGKRITFLDTPGHEAFTAMRARGAKVTDIVILVVAADDRVMPQTKEAINHAMVAQVPIIVAINKVDKPAANPDKIREELSAENILVEEWGGKYQCQEVSAKKGTGIPELLEKILLEAEVLELTANPDREAKGTVIEAALDRGRGYVATLLVQSGTLNIGDVVLAGANYGKVKAMTDHKGMKLDKVGPSGPVQVLGLDGAPQAGDKFLVYSSEREARDIATKRSQIMREQSIRTKKHITLDEIGRRLAIGSFKELNLILKADVDGSLEALSDSMLKLSTGEIQINILHKAVGQISESDVLLASASDAIIVGFQVRPSTQARKLAEQEQIEIRLYSIIYKAIEEIKDAMEGMLEPTTEEVITGTVQVRQVFKISKIGTVAGCYVLDGFIKRKSKVRLVRDGIVVYSGEIDALKRFKDDVSEVKKSFECGISLAGYNDLRENDEIEAFEMKEVQRKL